ncbi:hypothetical protein, partial [Lacticaseibacillus paracasei]|uniref:hypothetical protein n=1 Tax=Lacticaseibacillus paracasei TaxID=1597 RepID=UPI001CDB9CD6
LIIELVAIAEKTREKLEKNCPIRILPISATIVIFLASAVLNNSRKILIPIGGLREPSLIITPFGAAIGANIAAIKSATLTPNRNCS